MKSKILLSLMVIVIAVSMAVGGTMAYFSDTATQGIVVSAGTLDLKVKDATGNWVDDDAARINVSNMKPGDTHDNTFNLKNTGSVNGYLNISDVLVSAGSLASLLEITLYYEGVSIWSGMVNDMPGSPSLKTINIGMNAGETVQILARLHWPTRYSNDVDNAAQGDKFSIDFIFELTQAS